MADVEITLDGKSETLRPSLKAAKRLSAAGGFQNVVNRLQSGDIEYYFLVVAAALDRKNTEVEEKVFRTGLPALAGGLVKFCKLLRQRRQTTPPEKLKTVVIDERLYAEVDDRGEPVYVDDEPDPGADQTGEAKPRGLFRVADDDRHWLARLDRAANTRHVD
jgi:hypothetical protein